MKMVKSAPTRAQQVYEIIRDDILDGRLAPNVHLVQEEVAARLSVSRQPVQQAMLLLRSEGLVTESGARGLCVAPIDPERVRHHYQIRTSLDRLAAGIVADRICQGDVEVRDQLFVEGRKYISEGKNAEKNRSAPEAVALDMQFHSLIYKCSGNPLIAVTAEPHWSFLRRVMVSVLLHAGRGPIVWREHETILETLLSGDARKVDQMVTDHILGAERALIKVLTMTGA